jgi:hypothetical protein
MATDPDTTKHNFSHDSVLEQAGHVHHQFGVSNEAVHVFAGVAGPIFQVVEEAGRVEVLSFPGVEP